MDGQNNHRNQDGDRESIRYSVFSYAEKWCIVCIVSFAA